MNLKFKICDFVLKKLKKLKNTKKICGIGGLKKNLKFKKNIQIKMQKGKIYQLLWSQFKI